MQRPETVDMKTAVDVIILTFQRGTLVPPPAGARVLAAVSTSKVLV